MSPISGVSIILSIACVMVGQSCAQSNTHITSNIDLNLFDLYETDSTEAPPTFKEKETANVNSDRPTLLENCTCTLPEFCYGDSVYNNRLQVRVGVLSLIKKTTKCAEKYVCCPFDEVESNLVCGSNRLLNQPVATRHQPSSYSWTVAIMTVDQNTYVGGGSLIHRRVILTAYHPIRDLNLTNIKVRAGKWNDLVTRNTFGYDERLVQKIAYSKQFDPVFLDNNVALLYLAEPFRLYEHMNTICLPTARETIAANQNCFMSSWNQLRSVNIDKLNGHTMKNVRVTVRKNVECERLLQHGMDDATFILNYVSMCGVEDDRVAMPKMGDGGSPLVCEKGGRHNLRYYQYGIVSWSVKDKPDLPTVYTRITRQRQWIDNTMAIWNLSPNSYTYVD